MNGNQETILFVDDEKNIREGLSKLMEKKGYFCIDCSNPEDALNLLVNGKKVDIVVTDCWMHGFMNGIQFAIEVRKMPQVDVAIILTSSNLPQIYYKYKDIFDGVITKPFYHNELFNVIANVKAKIKVN